MFKQNKSQENNSNSQSPVELSKETKQSILEGLNTRRIANVILTLITLLSVNSLLEPQLVNAQNSIEIQVPQQNNFPSNQNVNGIPTSIFNPSRVNLPPVPNQNTQAPCFTACQPSQQINLPSRPRPTPGQSFPGNIDSNAPLPNNNNQPPRPERPKVTIPNQGNNIERGFVPNFIKPTTGTFTQGYKPFKHEGIDIAGPLGRPIVASERGVVETAGWSDFGLGNMVVILHPDGSRTTYGHNSKLLVVAGQTVEKGATISLMGSTGNSTGPHLHFEITKDERTVDPTSYFRL
jgi:murein DD-endopeptidase MepM/ murein hydrolase activator NlpD